MPANKALAYNKDINYSILEIGKKKIIAEKLIFHSVIKDCDIKDIKF